MPGGSEELSKAVEFDYVILRTHLRRKREDVVQAGFAEPSSSAGSLAAV